MARVDDLESIALYIRLKAVTSLSDVEFIDYRRLLDKFLRLIDDPDIFSDVVCMMADEKVDYDRYVLILKTVISQGGIRASSVAGYDLLEDAVMRGKNEAVRMLLEAGISANCPQSVGSTMAHLAAETGHTETLEILLSHGADLGGHDYVRASVLEAAIGTRQYDMVQYLLENHMNTLPERQHNELVALDWAVAFGNCALVRLLLRNGYDPNRVIVDIDPQLSDSRAPTAFYLALTTSSSTQPYQVVQHLIRAGLDVDQSIRLHSGITYPRKLTISETLVDYAIAVQRYQVVRALFMAGVSLNCRKGVVLPEDLQHWKNEVPPLAMLARKQTRKSMPCGYIDDIITVHKLSIPVGLARYLDFPEFEEENTPIESPCGV